MRKKESLHRPRLNFSDNNDDNQLLCSSYYHHHHNDFQLILPGEDDLPFPLTEGTDSGDNNSNDDEQKDTNKNKETAEEESSPPPPSCPTTTTPETPISQIVASHSGHEDEHLLFLEDDTLNDEVSFAFNRNDFDSDCDATVLEEDHDDTPQQLFDDEFLPLSTSSGTLKFNSNQQQQHHHRRKTIAVGRFPSISSTSTKVATTNDDNDKDPNIIVDDWDILTAIENLKKDRTIYCGENEMNDDDDDDDVGVMSSMSTATTSMYSDWDAVSSVHSVLSMETFQTARSSEYQRPPKKTLSQTSHKDAVQNRSTTTTTTTPEASANKDHNDEVEAASSFASTSASTLTTTITKSNDYSDTSSPTTMMIPTIIESSDSNDSRDIEESSYDYYDEREGFKFARGGKSSMMFRRNDNRRRRGRKFPSSTATDIHVHGNRAVSKLSTTKNSNERKQGSSKRDISTPYH